jgi:uncharacterized membrane protein YagU involved in acid resistance
MTAGFWVARRLRYLDEIPPHKAVRSVTPRVPEPQLSLLSAAAHLGVGGTAGAVYSLLAPKQHRTVLTGALFGVAVWLVGYEAVMPATTDIEPAHRDARQRAASILIAHLIYGAVLGWLTSSSCMASSSRRR